MKNVVGIKRMLNSSPVCLCGKENVCFLVTIRKACLKMGEKNSIWVGFQVFENVKLKPRLSSPFLKFSSSWVHNLTEVSDVRVIVIGQAVLFFHTWESSHAGGAWTPTASLDVWLRHPFCARLCRGASLFAFAKKRKSRKASLYSLLCL